ncbi:MAG: phosphoglucosamine mutase [Candidatus Marinimicrobia bacterium]|nr:phosphoglucosamine mutase [Candidatus Neomarinimicrobiota bacterium]MBL7059885.1 phosphoglucosamine mutase [Candidatus Neomarinimicrobiota bacterium]
MIIRSISGVRGITDTNLTESTARIYARALHHILSHGVIMVGMDGRPSGQFLIQAFVEELSVHGRDVIVCGIVPTPTIQFMVEQTEAVGGVIITASHNPAEWNGFKFVREDGAFFHLDQCINLFDRVDEKPEQQTAERRGMIWMENNAIQKHVIHNVSLKCIDSNAIRKRHFKVVIDAVNAAGSEALPMMLDALGCKVIELYCDRTGEFVRGTEPLPHNLTDLSKVVVDNQADIGFAVDPDADRLAIVDEKGHPLGEEYTLAIAGEGYLKTTSRNEPFVVNMSTSMVLEKMAEKYGVAVKRAAVGEINVVNKMEEIGTLFGGEGNGGVILKEAHLGRDSLVAATLVLNRLAQVPDPVSNIKLALPQFEIVKDKVLLTDVDVEMVLQKMRAMYSDADINTIDGVKFTWNTSWVHLRKSNTEPIMRIYAEAETAEKAQDLVSKVKRLFN